MVHNSDGKVMAPLVNRGTFYEGKRVDVTITEHYSDEDVPKIAREALIGLKVSTIFDYEQMGKTLKCPPGSRLAYVMEVVEVLEAAGKKEAAEALKKSLGPGQELALACFRQDEYLRA
jgi:hypothetical protein